MKVLVACEFSGVVREAFRARGHNAWSCDLLPAADGSKWHYQCDIRYLLSTLKHWDLMIAHPPCTYLASSGLHWNNKVPGRSQLTAEALDFVRYLMQPYDPSFAAIKRIAVENPVGCISTQIRKPDQIIQPWQFGEDASKATCLWLKNLPLLIHTNELPGGKRARRANQTPSGQNKLGPSKDRERLRGITYRGIAEAMADQWGKL